MAKRVYRILVEFRGDEVSQGHVAPFIKECIEAGMVRNDWARRNFDEHTLTAKNADRVAASLKRKEDPEAQQKRILAVEEKAAQFISDQERMVRNRGTGVYYEKIAAKSLADLLLEVTSQ